MDTEIQSFPIRFESLSCVALNLMFDHVTRIRFHVAFCLCALGLRVKVRVGLQAMAKIEFILCYRYITVEFLSR